jgi:hypothetical protein
MKKHNSTQGTPRIGSGDWLGVWSDFTNPIILANGKRIKCKGDYTDYKRIYANVETNPVEQTGSAFDSNADCPSFDCRRDCRLDCLRHPTIYFYLGITPNDPSNARKCHANPRKLKDAQIIGTVTFNPPAHGNRKPQQPGCKCNNPVAKFILRLLTPILMFHLHLMYNFRVHDVCDAKTPNEKS